MSKTQLQKIWNTDAPKGKAWVCPDCNSWATLGGNAGFHVRETNHRLPVLLDQPETVQPEMSEQDFGAECAATLQEELDRMYSVHGSRHLATESMAKIINDQLARRQLDTTIGVPECQSPALRQASAELSRCREEAAQLRRLIINPDDVLTEFERIGDWYYSETGFLRPGKSEPMASGRDSNSRENVARFADWFDDKKRQTLTPAPAPASSEVKP